MTEASDQLSPISIFTQNEGQLLQNWIKNLSQSALQKEPNATILKEESREFFNQLVSTVQKGALQITDAASFRPIVDLLKQLLRSRKDLGFGQRDMALYLLTLKKTFLQLLGEYYQGKDFNYDQEAQNFSNIIDILGLITLEALNEEKETLIQKQQEALQRLRDEIKTHMDFEQVIARSPAMMEVLHLVHQILDSPVTVLLEGDSGTGKEVIARMIHYQGFRQDKPFVVLNCGAIPENLLESELFGHEKGSFTGAVERQLGKFELAHEGTLFLDEIGELSLAMQVKLLRVLQQKEIQRIGGNETISVNVRAIAATNRNLKTMVDNGKFRLDLLYRLNLYPILIPQLRRRPEDIIPLALHFLELASKEYAKKVKLFTDDALERLQGYEWPGNVRELQNVVHRAVLLATGTRITSDLLNIMGGKVRPRPLISSAPAALMLTESKAESAPTEVQTLDDMERVAILNALEKMNGNVSAVAKALGISRTTFYNKAKRYSIEIHE